MDICKHVIPSNYLILTNLQLVKYVISEKKMIHSSVGYYTAINIFICI